MRAAPAGLVHGCQLEGVTAAVDDCGAEVTLRFADTLRSRRQLRIQLTRGEPAVEIDQHVAEREIGSRACCLADHPPR